MATKPIASRRRVSVAPKLPCLAAQTKCGRTRMSRFAGRLSNALAGWLHLDYADIHSVRLSSRILFAAGVAGRIPRFGELHPLPRGIRALHQSMQAAFARLS
jgi:hypothetical protein